MQKKIHTETEIIKQWQTKQAYKFEGMLDREVGKLINLII